MINVGQNVKERFPSHGHDKSTSIRAGAVALGAIRCFRCDWSHFLSLQGMISHSFAISVARAACKDSLGAIDFHIRKQLDA